MELQSLIACGNNNNLISILKVQQLVKFSLMLTFYCDFTT